MTSLKITTTDELLAVLPHQLGHRLDDCIVIALVRDRVLGPVARTDLPRERDTDACADQLLASLLRVEPELALVVGFESVPGQSRSLRRALHEGLTGAGVGIIDHVVVREGRWWGACCRPCAGSLDGLVAQHADGHAVPDDASVPAVAELIATGSAPLASRDQVSALVAEDPTSSAGVGEALHLLDGVDPVDAADPSDVSAADAGRHEHDLAGGGRGRVPPRGGRGGAPAGRGGGPGAGAPPPATVAPTSGRGCSRPRDCAATRSPRPTPRSHACFDRCVTRPGATRSSPGCRR